MEVRISTNREAIDIQSVVALYKANEWSSADKPELLFRALRNSHSLVTAWIDEELVGLGNAISDGYLVVYYPHLLVHPDYHGKGIGGMIAAEMQKKYKGFHMQMLTADGRAIDFYKKQGFRRAGQTEPMWIYGGGEH